MSRVLCVLPVTRSGEETRHREAGGAGGRWGWQSQKLGADGHVEAREKAPWEKSPENREGTAAGRKAQGMWEAAAGTVSVPGLGRFGL